MFERDLSSLAIKYADKHFKLCPFCQTNIPDWKVEVSAVSSRMKKYSFLCHQCEGIIDVNAANDDAFKTESFNTITLGNVGRGQYNFYKRGNKVTLAELKEMCGDDSEPETPEVVATPIVEPAREDIVRRRAEPVRRVEPERRVETPRTPRAVMKPRRPFGVIGLIFAIISTILGLILLLLTIGNNQSISQWVFSLGLMSSILGIIFSAIGLKKSSNAAPKVGLALSIVMTVLIYLFFFFSVYNNHF